MDRSDKFINNRAPKRLVVIFMIFVGISAIFAWLISGFAAERIAREEIRIYLSAISGGRITAEPTAEDIRNGEQLMDSLGISEDMPIGIVWNYRELRRLIFLLIFVPMSAVSLIWLGISMRELFAVYGQIEELRSDCLKALWDSEQVIRNRGRDNDCIERICDACERLSDRMNRLRSDLESDKEYLRDFLGDFSHQIKTSLAVIRLNTDILAESENLDEDSRRRLDEEIQLNLDSMEELVVQVIKLARLDMETVEYRRDLTSAAETCTRAVDRIKPLLRSQGITIETDLPDDIMLMHDRGWTCEAIGNILKNSADHSECDTIRVELTEDHISVKIVISDNGKGIPQSDIPKLFERFSRKTTDRSMRSAGMGMSIAQKVIRGQNGEIMVYSQEGEGTRFEIVFLKQKLSFP